MLLSILLRLSLIVALFIIVSHDLLEVREDFSGGVGTSGCLPLFGVYRLLLLVLRLHLLHLASRLANSKLLCESEALLAECLLLLRALGLEGSLDLSFLGGSLLSLFFFSKFSLLSESTGIDLEDLTS